MTRYLFLLNDVDRFVSCIEFPAELLVGVLGQIRLCFMVSYRRH